MLRTQRLDNPFVGLRPFNWDESHLFFGREGQTDELLRRLQRTQFLAVIGTSGSGKSSLVRAGLLPALYGGFMVKAGSAWQVAVMRPGNAPIANLAAALHHPKVFDIEPEYADIQPLVTETTLRLSNLGLIEVVQRADLPPENNLLIVVDQFEELFRFRAKFRFKEHVQTDKAATDEAVNKAAKVANESAAFVNLLLEAAKNHEVPVYVVLTMRSDFLGECAQFRNLPEAINDSQYLIPRMTRDELRSAIVGPIAVGGGKITSRLVNQLLNDVGDNPDQLSVLQHALLRTWNYWKEHHPDDEYIDLPDYWEIGGMGRALSNHADEVYKSLDNRGKGITEVLFKQLTEKGADNRGFRRPTRLGDVCAVAKATPEEVVAVVEQFRQPGRSFLMPPEPDELTPETPLDISHESLMRIWDRLRDWVEEEAESAAIYRRLAETSALHEADHTDLLQGTELEVNLEWFERANINSAWAERYAPNYNRTIKFLALSRVARDESKRALERLQQETLERKQQENQKLRRLLILAFSSFAIAVVAAIFAFFQYREAEHRRLEAEIGQLAALRSSSDANFASNRQLESLLASLKAGRKLQLLLAQNKQVDEATSLRTLGVLQQRVYEVRERNRLQGHTQLVRSVSFSPDGQYIASASNDRTVKRWGRNGKWLNDLPHGESVLAVEFSPDSKALASITSDGKVQLWQRSSKQPKVFPQQVKANRLSFSPNGGTLATANNDKTVKLWSTQDGRLLNTLPHQDWVNGVRFSRDGITLVSASKDKTVKLWSRDGRLLNAFRGHTGEVEEATLSPDGQFVVSGGHDKTVRLWQRDGTLIKTLDDHKEIVYSVDFSPDGEVFASAGADGTVRLWRNKDGELLNTFRGSNRAVRSVRFSPDGQILAATGDDGKIILWSRDIQNLVTVLKGHTDRVTSVSLSPDGQTLVSGSDDNTIRIWNRYGKPLRTLSGHSGQMTQVRFSPDGQQFASASWDKTIKLWQPNGTLLHTLPKQSDGVNSISFSPDSQILVSAGLDGSIRLWTRDGQALKLLAEKNDRGEVVDVNVSPDGRTIASVDKGGQIVNLRSLNGENLVSFSENRDNSRVAFSPDQQSIATSADKVISLWKWHGNEVKLSRSFEHDRNVRSIGFTTDGQFLLSASSDKTIRFWNFQSRETTETLLSTLHGHTAAVNDVSFDATHQVVASASDDQTIILWRVGLKDLLALGCREVQDYLRTLEADQNVCVGIF